MSEIIYSTRLEIEGPWMLDRNALIELDNILSHMRKQLEKQTEDRIEFELQEYLKLLDPQHEDYEKEKKREESL